MMFGETRGYPGERIQPKESPEKQAFKKDVREFLELVIQDAGIKKTLDKWKLPFVGESSSDHRKRTSVNDLELYSKLAINMYNLIHKSGMTYQEVMRDIQASDKEEFIRTFDDENEGRLVKATKRTSKIRHMTAEELEKAGHSDQARAFVWFKGNAPMPNPSREVRFYLNTRPEGTVKMAEFLGKISDTLDSYGIRVQFKFRKDLGEYDRTDTCIAYVYLPKSNAPGQQAREDDWVKKIADGFGQAPAEVLRKKNPFFTKKIKDGISIAEDTRTGSKSGESYTSQITKTIAETCGELATKYSSFTPEAVEAITKRAVEKLAALNYFA